jgi:glucose-fructose oxidoreductase
MRKKTNGDIQRRDVLKGIAAGAATSPFLVSARALGLEDVPAASERVAIGHIGFGNRGGGVFGGIRQSKDAESVAVSDCYQNKRERFVGITGGKAYADFRDLLADDGIDGVVIATPDHWHVPIAVAAARAKKDAYVEKPLGVALEQDVICQKVFEENERIFQYGTQQRSMRHCWQACEQVRRGAIGKVIAIEVDAPNGGAGGSTTEVPLPEGLDYDMWLGPAPVTPYTADRCKPPGSYWIYDQSVGYLGGWGAHPLDLMVWGSDADISGPVVVEGTGDIPTEGLYDCVWNWDMQIKLGVVDLVFKPGGDRTKFIGEDGWISVSRNSGKTTASDPEIMTEELDPEDDILVRSTHHQDNYIQSIKSRTPAVSPIADSVRSDVISLLSDIAVRTGETITWDPSKQALVDPSDAATALFSRPMRDPWTL